jgi:hypothetical protein
MQNLFRIFRIVCLLIIFASLAFYAKTQKLKARSWTEPLEIVIYPINGEDSPIVEQYIHQLDNTAFKEIDQFFKDEADYYGLDIEQPTSLSVGAIMREHLPVSPTPGSSIIRIVWWAIKFRYWAFSNTPDSKSNLHRIRVFVHYHETKENKRLQHSLGLDKGLLAIVHAFASTDQEQQNNIVIAHELLHTVGATDKYNQSNQPLFPDGYADPNKRPIFPQLKAEIMAAKIPANQHESVMAASLSQCIIGNKTAMEINWIRPQN